MTNRKIALGLGGLILLVVAGDSIYKNYVYVSTDNAAVQAATSLLAAKVSGIVGSVRVRENQKVKAGDILVELKSEDFQNSLEHAKAELAALEAQSKVAQSQFHRTKRLFDQGALTQEQYDTAESSSVSLSRRVDAAKAQLAQANLNLDYAQIKAPEDGIVGRKSFELGMYVNTGQPLAGFVAGKDRWVVANVKETDLPLIKIGNPVDIEVDALPGRALEGEVESLSPSTGSVFSLLPPDNATGNFTKVVQRIPVRIKLNALTESDLDSLRPGLSATVKIRIRMLKHS